MIRPYSPSDDEALIQILRLNTPQYFDVSEEADFVMYLAHHTDHYFVVEKAGEIVGSGGFNFFDEHKLARISWDLIHPDHQGRGIGRELTLFRINELNKQDALRVIMVRTTQLVYPFYEKLGFKLEKTEKDFWAKGFDLYQMKMELN